jgi:putative membrane protein
LDYNFCSVFYLVSYQPYGPVYLAFSAFYELVEWWVALATGDNAEAFLGTQGYLWDTQSDMALALLGAIIALITLSKMHDRQLNKAEKGRNGETEKRGIGV